MKKIFKNMDKLKSNLFEDLGEMLKPMTDKEKEQLVKEAKAKQHQAHLDYMRGGHMTSRGFWTGD